MRELLTIDVVNMSKIISKMDIKKDIKELVPEIRAEKRELAGVDLIFMLINGAAKAGVDKELYNFIAEIIGEPADKIARMPFNNLVDKIKEVADPESWASFFKQAARLTLS